MFKVTFKPYANPVVREHQSSPIEDQGQAAEHRDAGREHRAQLQAGRGDGDVEGDAPPTRGYNEENLDGRVHCLRLSYEMLEYEPSVSYKEMRVTFPAIGPSHNPVYGGAAKWLKERKGQR